MVSSALSPGTGTSDLPGVFRKIGTLPYILIAGTMISFLFIDTERVWRGGQAQLFTLIRGLHQRGHSVHLICYPKTLLVDRAQQEGIHVHPLAFRSEIGLISFFRIAALIRNNQAGHPRVQHAKTDFSRATWHPGSRPCAPG